MTALDVFRRRSRRATSVLGGVLVAVLVLAAVALWQGIGVLRRYEAARNVTASAISVPKTWVGLWGTLDTEGDLGSLTAVVSMPGEALGGHLVSIPISATATPDAPVSFRDVYRADGDEALRDAVERALNVGFDVVQVSTPAEFAALVAPVTPAVVDLVDDVPGTDIAAGSVSLGAEQLASVLNAYDGDDAARRPNVVAVWRGLAAQIGEGRTSASGEQTPTTMPELLTRVMAGPVDVAGLATWPIEDAGVDDDRVDDGTDGDGSTDDSSAVVNSSPDRSGSTVAHDDADDVLTVLSDDVDRVDIVQAVLVFASVAPSNMAAPAPGLIFRLEAPPGSEARVYDAIATLMYLGGNVTQVSLQGAVYDATQIFVSDRRDLEGLEDNPLFGKVEYLTTGTRILGVDVQVRLGADYLSKPAIGDRDTSVSTTTTLDPTVASTADEPQGG